MLKSELGVTRRRLESFESEVGSSSDEADSSLSSRRHSTTTVDSAKNNQPTPNTAEQSEAERVGGKATSPAGGYSSGSDPELSRLRDENQSKGTDQKQEDVARKKGPVVAALSARFRPGAAAKDGDVSKPALAPKPAILKKDDNCTADAVEGGAARAALRLDGGQSPAMRLTPTMKSKGSRTPSPTKSLKEAPICSTPDFSRLRENLRKVLVNSAIKYCFTQLHRKHVHYGE